MSTCIFCRVEAADLTDEHVFPAALGGDIVLKQGLAPAAITDSRNSRNHCSPNSRPFRALFRIQNPRGDAPEVETTIRTEKKDYVGRLEGWMAQFSQNSTVTENARIRTERKRVRTSILDPTPESEAAEGVNQKESALRGNWTRDRERAEIHIGGDLKEIGSLNGLRTIAKIAYVGLAYFAGVRLAIGYSFGKGSQFHYEGFGKNKQRVSS